MSFKSKSTLSSLRISTTNIRGLGVGGPNEGKKLNCLLDLKTDLTVITDSHADLTKLNSLKSNNRQLFIHLILNPVQPLLSESVSIDLMNYYIMIIT